MVDFDFSVGKDIEMEFTTPAEVEFGMDVPGRTGKSAYDIWLEQGNEGTKEDFLNSLKGDDYILTETDKEEIAERAAEKVQKPDIPEGMASEDWVNANFQPKGKYVTDEELEEKLKDVSPEGYATEEWTNENFQPKGNYLEEIPAEYVTETELEAKGYQTKTEADGTYQPKGSYATTEQLSATEKKIPTKNSQLENDSGYLKSYTETDPTVPSWAKQTNKPSYKKSEIGLGNVANERQYSANNPPPYPVTSVNGRTGAVEVEEKGTAQTKVTNHNADDEAHTDIRLLISALTKKVNDLLDSDDTTLDQMSEVVAYIKANREILESYTTEKVNVADIIDNLTTSVSNKPLSAKQGVQLKALIDAIKVPTALSQLAGDSTHRTVTDSEKAAWNAKSDFSGEYADLKNKPTKVTDFTNDAGYQTAQQVQNYAQPKGNYITEADLQEATDNALAQAKASGKFDGKDGKDGKDGTIQVEPLFAESLEWLEENGDTSKVYILPDGFIYAYTLTKKEVESGGGYTNLLPTAKATDRTTIYGGDYNGDGVNDGYLQNRRLSSSGGDSSKDGCCCTGFILSVKEGDILRMAGWQDAVGTSLYIISYKSDNTKVSHITYGAYAGTGYTYSDGLFTIPLTSENFGTGFDAIRISSGSMENLIVTINEEIKEGGGTSIVEEYAWTSTGHAFVPADYEEDINTLKERTLRHTEEISALKKAVEDGSGNTLTDSEKLAKIKTWDKPVFDFSPVTLIADDRVKPALTTADRTVEAIYAKYRALMAQYPDYITETNMGKCTSSDTFTAVDMLRFDFKEPDGLTQPDLTSSALHETKPKIIFMSGVHTEWVGVWGLYYALEEIATNPDFDDIRRNAHIIVIPCANPYCLAWETAIDGWRMSHVNANGVAIHNNFNVDHKTSGAVGEYNYGGSAPCSELETQYIDKVMADNPDAVAFVSCHNNDYSTYYGSHVIWASSATYHMCNVAFRLVDKMSKAWIDKYGQTLKDAIDNYKINMDANDYRLGRATMSSSAGTEQKNATKYGIQGVNVEISRMMKVFSGNTDGTSEVMTHGAEVYANLMRTLLTAYNHTDKAEYYK